MKHKRFTFLAIIALAALVLAACGASPLAGTGSADDAATVDSTTGPDTGDFPRTVNVNGVGIAYGAPDTATVRIGVELNDPDAQTAVAEGTARATAIVDAVKALGVDDKDIQTTEYNIFPSQQRDRNGNLTGIVYFVNYTISVTFRDIDLLGPGLTAVTEAGANNVFGINFSVSDPTALMAEARAAAIEDAINRATQLAEGTGATLGRVQNISEFSFRPVPIQNQALDTAVSILAGAPVPIESGQNSIQVEVNITWELE